MKILKDLIKQCESIGAKVLDFNLENPQVECPVARIELDDNSTLMVHYEDDKWNIDK